MEVGVGCMVCPAGESRRTTTIKIRNMKPEHARSEAQHACKPFGTPLHARIRHKDKALGEQQAAEDATVRP